MRADKIMVLPSKWMFRLVSWKISTSAHLDYLFVCLFIYFAWAWMSKFPKHWKPQRSKVHFVRDSLTCQVTVQTLACPMPDGTQLSAFSSSSNTCCLSTENAPAPCPGWAQQELWHTAPVWITLPSPTERALKPADSHVAPWGPCAAQWGFKRRIISFTY